MLRTRWCPAMADAGFKLCKWRSSRPEVLEDEEPAPEMKDFRAKNDAGEEVGKLLGMRYSFSADEFSYAPDEEKAKMDVETKRQMLQVIASFFDPLGFLDPFIVWARLILQKVMKMQIGWDEKKIEESLLRAFKTWQADFEFLKNFKIVRWTATPATQDGKKQLMVCSDASGEGYGVVIYV